MATQPQGPNTGARSRIVVGYHGGSTGQDALVFAQRWCQASGDRMLVVTVHRGHAAIGLGRVDAEFVAYERERADQFLNEARTMVSSDVDAEYRRIDADSAAHGLHDLCDEGGNLVVLGSRARGPGLRRTYPGTTASRLLQGASRPICIVPWGYAGTEDAPLRRVAAAFIDTPDGRVAVERAAGLAAHLGADLRIVSVAPDTRVLPGLTEPELYAAEQRKDYRRSLDDVTQQFGDQVSTSTKLLEGHPVEALAELGDEDGDIVVCGSRGYGPVRRVLLGGVSSRVVRHARLPVVVVPRGDS